MPIFSLFPLQFEKDSLWNGLSAFCFYPLSIFSIIAKHKTKQLFKNSNGILWFTCLEPFLDSWWHRIKKCISCQGLESLCDLPIFNLNLVALPLSHYSWIPLSQGLVVKRWSGLSWLWAFCTCYFLFLECSCSLHTGSFASFFRSQFEGYQPQEACGSSKLRSFTCSFVIPLPSPTCY